MNGRFDYVAYDEDAMASQLQFKQEAELLEQMIHDRLQPGRSQALAFTKLEEFYMWVGKAIRDDQIKRNGSAPLQEGRSNT